MKPKRTIQPKSDRASTDTLAARRTWGIVWVFALAAVPLAALLTPEAHSQPAPPRNSLGALAPKAQPVSRERLVGIEAIAQELGDAMPTGRGVPTAHIEGVRGDYLPRRSLPQFRDVRFAPRSGQSKANSHTTATARTIYGTTGLAPGINDVHVYASAHWLAEGYLNAMTAFPPRHDDRRLMSHSWIRPTGGVVSQDIIRRADYLIDTHDVVMVVGVNNGRETAIPAVLGSAYNVIAAGVRDGDSSGGYTWFEVAGRCKPDLVSIGGKTSFSTPTIAAIAARLIETADRMAASDERARNAPRAEVIKAVLMAGAQKRDGWQREEHRPLDKHLGAGFARFDHSYRILTAGPASTRDIDPLGGWAFVEQPAGEREVAYEFELTEPVREISVILTWHRRIGGSNRIILREGRPTWDTTPRLANFDLELIHLNAGVGPVAIEESRSRVDNVEHIYRRQLDRGRYRLVVHRLDAIHEPWDFALAWRSHTAAQPQDPEEIDEPPVEDETDDPAN